MSYPAAMDDTFASLLGDDAAQAFEYERVFRSQIIVAAITLELQIDRIIAWYFCSDEAKHPLLYSLIFHDAEVRYSAKVTILKKLLQLAYPELSAPFAFLPRELRKLGELRNKLAHCDIEVAPNASSSPAGVTIIRYRNGTRETEFISTDQVDMALQTFRTLREALALVLLVIRDTARGVLEPGTVTKLASFGAPLARKLPQSK